MEKRKRNGIKKIYCIEMILAVEYASGTKYWYKDGKYHRKDHSAVEDGGYRAWYLDGQRHRIDAIQPLNGKMALNPGI